MDTLTGHPHPGMEAAGCWDTGGHRVVKKSWWNLVHPGTRGGLKVDE